MEGKQGTACQSRLMGTWRATAMVARVDQFFHAGADEGDAEQVVVVLVDDHAGRRVAVGVQARPGTATPRSTSTTRMRCPACSAWSAVRPTAPTGGSQKNTCGTAR